MKKDRVDILARTAALLVQRELADAPDDYCGELTITFAIYKGGTTGVSSERKRSHNVQEVTRPFQVVGQQR